MKTSTPSRLAAAVAIPILAFSLSSCGNDDAEAVAFNDTETTDASSETATGDTAAEVASEVATPEAATPEADGDTPVAASGDSTASVVASSYLGDYTLSDDEFGTMVTVTVDGDIRTIDSNSLPDHETGDFPNAGNPNTISEQDLVLEYTTTPTYTGGASFAQMPGVAINGIAFEPGTAESISCSSGETSRIEAVQDLYNLGLDFNNAHVQPTGQYHYHGVSELLVEAYSSDEDLVHVGFAADGFLMYYSKSGAYDSSYVLSSDARTGTDCTASGPAGGETIDLEGTTPDGTYDTDWDYVDGAGDLDSCNGTTIDGEYAYVLTNEYPYISRCLNGDYQGGGPGGGGAPGGEQGAAPGQDGAAPAAQGAAPGGGGAPGPPDLAAAATTLGITEAELMDALGGPPPDLDAAAATLGITVEDLEAALG